jgi:Protein of unknown function (DUF3617)
MSNRILVAALAATWMLITPAAAYEFEPGQWQETATGTEDGKPAPPEDNKRCISEAEASDAMKALKVEEMKSGDCQTSDVEESGDTLTVKFRCKQAYINLDATYKFGSRKSFTGQMKMSMAMFGKSATMERTIVGKWLGSCP